MHVVTNIPQPTCMAIFNELINSQKVLWYLRLGFFFVLRTLTSFQSWCEILQSRIKSKSFVEIGRLTNYLQKVIPARISNVRLVFVIRNNSGVQIFRNDEKARQRHLPKMDTLVVTMNWNRFLNSFRIRFCIFYNRSELSHCITNGGWSTSVVIAYTLLYHEPLDLKRLLRAYDWMY